MPAEKSDLEKDYDFYLSIKDRYLPAQSGQHVLIQYGKVVGVYPTREEALLAGHKMLGTDAHFIVQELQVDEPCLRIGYAAAN